MIIRSNKLDPLKQDIKLMNQRTKSYVNQCVPQNDKKSSLGIEVSNLADDLAVIDCFLHSTNESF